MLSPIRPSGICLVRKDFRLFRLERIPIMIIGKFPHTYQAEQIRLDILQASAPPRIYEFHVIQCEERN